MSTVMLILCLVDNAVCKPMLLTVMDYSSVKTINTTVNLLTVITTTTNKSCSFCAFIKDTRKIISN